MDMDHEDVPQIEPLGPTQVMNNSGGYTFQALDMDILMRGLLMGFSVGCYKAGSQDEYNKIPRVLTRLLGAGLGITIVEKVKEISGEGRAPKQSPGIFALGVCACYEDPKVRSAAYDAVEYAGRHRHTLSSWIS